MQVATAALFDCNSRCMRSQAFAASLGQKISSASGYSETSTIGGHKWTGLEWRNCPIKASISELKSCRNAHEEPEDSVAHHSIPQNLQILDANSSYLDSKHKRISKAAQMDPSSAELINDTEVFAKLPCTRALFQAKGMTQSKKYRGLLSSSCKKKTGRPVQYVGDPNSLDITEAERKKIKRRISNRESARKVRNKQQAVLLDLESQVYDLDGKRGELEASLSLLEVERCDLLKQVSASELQVNITEAENWKLSQELRMLKLAYESHLRLLEELLNKQDCSIKSQSPQLSRTWQGTSVPSPTRLSPLHSFTQNQESSEAEYLMGDPERVSEEAVETQSCELPPPGFWEAGATPQSRAKEAYADLEEVPCSIARDFLSSVLYPESE